MTFTCPEHTNRTCDETRCGCTLSNPRPEGFDDNMNQLYTAACIFDGNIRYFEHLLPDPSTPKVGASSGTRRPVVCLELLRETIKKYLPNGKTKLGLLKDENFLDTLTELSNAHKPGYEIYKEDADYITALWMEIRLDLIAYFKTLEHNEIVDNFIRSLEHKDNHSFYTHFKRPEQESVLINEGLAKEFYFIAKKCCENNFKLLAEGNHKKHVGNMMTGKEKSAFISKAYPFIKEFNDNERRIAMEVYQKNDATTTVTITVIDGENVWKVIRQFAFAESSPITIENPRAKGPLNLKGMFEKTKNIKDNRELFYRFVRTVGKGCKSKYELSQHLVR